MVARPPSGSIPDEPGSYQFKDRHGRVIYVGKASSLRQRLSSYFADPVTPAPETRRCRRGRDRRVDHGSHEVEALILEFNLIKEHHPRFNVRCGTTRVTRSWP